MKIAILSQVWPDAIADLQARHDCYQEINPQPQRKAELLREAEVAVLRSPVKLDRKALEAAPRLRLIVRAGAGLESIDLKCAAERGIVVVAIPLSADSVAEHVFGLLLALYRKIPRLHRGLMEGRWEKHDGWGFELSGKTLGVVGFGRIGRRVTEIATAFHMPLLAYDRSPEKPVKQKCAKALSVSFVTLDELFCRSNVVSIQTPLNDHSRAMIGTELIGRMQPEAVLINVGRGGIVDEAALYAALSQGSIGGAAFDVFAEEPPVNSPLLSLDNFVGTPHVAAQTREAQRRVGEDVVRVIEAFERDGDLGSLGHLLHSTVI